MPGAIGGLGALWRSREAREGALVAGVFVLATVICTYPVAFTVGTRLPGWPGDAHDFLWKMWYVKHALLDLRQWSMLAPQIYYPFGLNLAATEMTTTATVAALPLTALFGEVTAYSLVMLASFVLSGFGVALIVRQLTGSWSAGIVGGLVFAFCDYRLQRLGGHLNLVQTQWPVFAFYFAERWLQERSPRQAGLAGLMVALSTLATLQYALMLAVLLPLYALVRGWPWGERLREARTWRGLAAGTLGLLPALPSVLLFLRAGADGLTQHPFAELDKYSILPGDFLLPEPFSPLARLATALLANLPLERADTERMVYLGAVALLLALVGVAVHRHSAVVKAYVAVGLVAVLFALGPTLHDGDGRVYVHLPGGVTQALASAGVDDFVGSRLSPELAQSLRAGEAFVPTPATVLVLTGTLDSFRDWGRFAAFTSLAVAVLAGLGTAAVLRAVPRPRARAGAGPGLGRAGLLLVVVLSGLVLADQARVPFPTFTPAPRPADLWLAEQPGDFAVMEYPLAKAYTGIALYSSMVQGKNITYGYSTFQPVGYRAQMPTLERFPEPATLALLADWQVRYVLVTPQAYGDAWPRLAQALGASSRLHLVADLTGTQIYELLP